MILYVDGGCSGNAQKDMTKRRMVSVVTDESGRVLIEKLEQGGSNNIAELLAVKEALVWAYVNKVAEVEILTDSRNNLAWVKGNSVGKGVNDRSAVMLLKNTIKVLRKDVRMKIIWIPRDKNLAGHYIENKYIL